MSKDDRQPPGDEPHLELVVPEDRECDDVDVVVDEGLEKPSRPTRLQQFVDFLYAYSRVYGVSIVLSTMTGLFFVLTFVVGLVSGVVLTHVYAPVLESRLEDNSMRISELESAVAYVWEHTQHVESETVEGNLEEMPTELSDATE